MRLLLSRPDFRALMQVFFCVCRCETVSLLDSLDSTLENEKKPHAVQRTSGDMHTIPELTGEISTNTRRNSEEVGSGDHISGQENVIKNGHAAVNGGRRLSNTQAGFTLSNDGSSNMSAKDFAGKTVSGRIPSLYHDCYSLNHLLCCICPYFDFKSVSIIATSVVHSKLDYCNYQAHANSFPFSSISLSLRRRWAPVEAICFRVVRPCRCPSVRACVRPSVIHVVVLCFHDISSIC